MRKWPMSSCKQVSLEKSSMANFHQPVCSICRSTDVESQAWMKWDEISKTWRFFQWLERTDTSDWCNNYQEHYQIVLRKDYKEKS